MSTSILRSGYKAFRRLFVFAFAILVLLLDVAGVSAQTICKPVHGTIEGTGLAEPCSADFCSIGLFKGAIKGNYLVATTLNQEQPDSNAIFYTGVTTATVHIGNGQGDLYIRNSGLYLPSGELTELETITGGTGAWVGASGVLFVSGKSGDSSAAFTYDGNLCTPR